MTDSRKIDSRKTYHAFKKASTGFLETNRSGIEKLAHLTAVFIDAVEKDGAAPLTRADAMAFQNIYDDLRLTAAKFSSQLVAAEDSCVETAETLARARRKNAPPSKSQEDVDSIQRDIHRESLSVQQTLRSLRAAYARISDAVAPHLPQQHQTPQRAEKTVTQSPVLKQAFGL